MPKPAQIVHESETQRQFIRLQMPAMADINGNRYTVKDLSSGGMAIRDFGKTAAKGEVLDLTLILPFNDFTLDVRMKAEIQHIDKKTDIAGCRFIDLNENQISILNHVIKSFMAGDIVGTNDLLNVVSRENFVNVRKHKQNEKPTFIENIKKYGIYGLVAIATLLLATFIINNIFEKMFILTTSNAYVHADYIEITSPASGTYESALTAGGVSVKKGQVIGYINESGFKGTEQSLLKQEIISPCDCFIIDTYVLNNEYKAQNAPLYNLLSQNSDFSVMAYVKMEDVHRLNIETETIINITGAKDPIKGKIIDIQNNQDAVDVIITPMAIVKIKPIDKITNDTIGRPAFVEFKL